MKTEKGIKKLPKHGYINDLAELCRCSRHTVRLALFENQHGKKSDLVRKMYCTNYKEVLQ